MSKKEKQEWYKDIYLKSDHWKEMRQKVYLKRGYRCSVLGCENKDLNMHHLSYEHIDSDEEYEDLRPLCWWHHVCAHYRFLPLRKVLMNRKELSKRYYEIKRFTWKFIRPSDLWHL